jgi:hypothetical protein
MHMTVVEHDNDAATVEGRMTVQPEHLAPTGYLHAATVVALADTAAGTDASPPARWEDRLRHDRTEDQLHEDSTRGRTAPRQRQRGTPGSHHTSLGRHRHHKPIPRRPFTNRNRRVPLHPATPGPAVTPCRPRRFRRDPDWRASRAWCASSAPRTANPQFSVARPPQTRDREPTQVPPPHTVWLARRLSPVSQDQTKSQCPRFRQT